MDPATTRNRLDTTHSPRHHPCGPIPHAAERLMRSGFWEYDCATGQVTWSKGLYALFGETPRDYRPRLRSFFDLTRPEGRDGVRQALHRGLFDGRGFKWQAKVERPDGSVCRLRCRGSAVRGADGRPCRLIGVCRDVTRESKLARELSHARRDQAAARLAAAVAHDLNNLLTVVGGLTELVLEGAVDARPALREIQRCATRAGELNRQLLGFCRGQSGPRAAPVVTDVGEMVRRNEALLRAVLGKGVALRSGVEPGPLSVRASPAELEQALFNLASNARDAMEDNGEFRLEVSVGAGPDGKNSRVLIRCTDTGCGMSENTKVHAFDPYYTTKPAGKGSGLGLAQVRTAVHRCGGSISLSSEPGRGTTFDISLPRLDPPPEDDPPPAA